ncbi:MAG: Fic family protein [Clostridia bacterium]|nr:Fic family protein [Clostridia bacterium]
MDKKTFISLITGKNYYDMNDLRYNKNVGLMLSQQEFSEFKSMKNELISMIGCGDFARLENEYGGKITSDLLDKIIKVYCKLPLKTFNSPHMFLINAEYLLSTQNEYLSLIANDLKEHEDILFNRNINAILNSRIFSEIEGTLGIENVPTTRKRISQIVNNSENLTDKNDIIVNNMVKALLYIINERPEFNKENLFKLYSILSDRCLTEDTALVGDNIYRTDEVSVGGFDGAPHEQIEELMDSLFDFVNNTTYRRKYETFLPHICHYYILYVHPYFDYNGRTARMVSFWISNQYHIIAAPLFLSEAINELKGGYYTALTNTRNMDNDLTYFIGYIFETSIKFSIVYKNVENIKSILALSGDLLSSTEEFYIRKILIHLSNGFFNSKMFASCIDKKISKQGAFNILNKLVEYNVLNESTNRKDERIFKINSDMLLYYNN